MPHDGLRLLTQPGLADRGAVAATPCENDRDRTRCEAPHHLAILFRQAPQRRETHIKVLSKHAAEQPKNMSLDGLLLQSFLRQNPLGIEGKERKLLAFHVCPEVTPLSEVGRVVPPQPIPNFGPHLPEICLVQRSEFGLVRDRRFVQDQQRAVEPCHTEAPWQALRRTADRAHLLADLGQAAEGANRETVTECLSTARPLGRDPCPASSMSMARDPTG